MVFKAIRHYDLAVRLGNVAVVKFQDKLQKIVFEICLCEAFQDLVYPCFPILVLNLDLGSFKSL